jgi:hypothetical protein
MSRTINLENAAEFTHSFQQSAKFSNETISSIFDKEDLLQVLNQDGCVGIRIYNALNSDNKMTHVVVGIDGNGDDMTDGTLLDYAKLCPDDCPPSTSPLM